MSEAQKGKVISEKIRKKVSEALKGRVISEETRKKIGKANKGKVMSEEARKKNSEAQKGTVLSEEHKKKTSIAIKRKWQDPKFVKKVRRYVCPNKPELKLLTFLSKDWLFTGGGKNVHSIDGKQPDFTNYKTKQVIELFGDYWHQGQDPKERTWFFERQGWKCLIVWQSELEKPNKLRSKLDRFCNNEVTDGKGGTVVGVVK